jgi:(R,R)-butanediol dehydrogenase/meso-butanediol dehydrogenase/diacetyl reductase
MRAAVLHAPGDLRIEEYAEPVAGPGTVVLAVAYNGLCGTDVTEYTKGPMMVPLTERHPGSGHLGPTILGHEFVGEVVDAGPGAEHWRGRRVASGAGVSCGTCRRCLAGRTNLCERYYTLGLSTHGALADYVAVPAATLREIPEGCAALDAALAQPLAVGLHAVDRSGVRPGDTVVLLGAGAIGSFILAGLAGVSGVSGASGISGHDGRVIAVDVDAGRLAAAERLGATETLLVDPDNSEDPVRDRVPGGADVVIESSGVPGAAQRAAHLVAMGGTVLLVGLVKTPQSLALADLVLREVTVRTTVAHVCDSDLPRALELLRDRPLAAELVGRVVPLERVVPDALEPLAAGTVSGKVLVSPLSNTGRQQDRP